MSSKKFLTFSGNLIVPLGCDTKDYENTTFRTENTVSGDVLLALKFRDLGKQKTQN